MSHPLGQRLLICAVSGHITSRLEPPSYPRNFYPSTPTTEQHTRFHNMATTTPNDWSTLVSTNHTQFNSRLSRASGKAELDVGTTGQDLLETHNQVVAHGNSVILAFQATAPGGPSWPTNLNTAVSNAKGYIDTVEGTISNIIASSERSSFTRAFKKVLRDELSQSKQGDLSDNFMMAVAQIQQAIDGMQLSIRRSQREADIVAGSIDEGYQD